jgi:hypothetical protein
MGCYRDGTGHIPPPALIYLMLADNNVWSAQNALGHPLGYYIHVANTLITDGFIVSCFTTTSRIPHTLTEGFSVRYVCRASLTSLGVFVRLKSLRALPVVV